MSADRLVLTLGSVPAGDWQFWVATGAAAAAAGWLLWRLIRAVRSQRRGAGKRVELTLDRKAVTYSKAGQRDASDCH
ncbi:MAG: hypothetical protein KDA21_10210 [Phycisphaerales bacterium]|nr:hypothetical protein [Phycisphaerales bacterium]